MIMAQEDAFCGKCNEIVAGISRGFHDAAL
jgi:hypothetical protein